MREQIGAASARPDTPITSETTFVDPELDADSRQRPICTAMPVPTMCWKRWVEMLGPAIAVLRGVSQPCRAYFSTHGVTYTSDN
jgi:hypothetical protein